MPFEPNCLIGYVPSTNEIKKDFSIKSKCDFGKIILSRCKKLYGSAQEKGNLTCF